MGKGLIYYFAEVHAHPMLWLIPTQDKVGFINFGMNTCGVIIEGGLYSRAGSDHQVAKLLSV